MPVRIHTHSFRRVHHHGPTDTAVATKAAATATPATLAFAPLIIIEPRAICHPWTCPWASMTHHQSGPTAARMRAATLQCTAGLLRSQRPARHAVACGPGHRMRSDRHGGQIPTHCGVHLRRAEVMHSRWAMVGIPSGLLWAQQATESDAACAPLLLSLLVFVGIGETRRLRDGSGETHPGGRWGDPAGLMREDAGSGPGLGVFSTWLDVAPLDWLLGGWWFSRPQPWCLKEVELCIGRTAMLVALLMCVGAAAEPLDEAHKPCRPSCIWGDAVCRALLGDPSGYGEPCRRSLDRDAPPDEAEVAPTGEPGVMRAPPLVLRFRVEA
jgi:hypothetical protein